MKLNVCLLISLTLVAAGCRNSSSDGSGAGSESEVSALPLQGNLKDWLITSGFIVDLDPESAGKRIQWLSRQSSELVLKSSVPTEASGAVACALDVNHDGQLYRVDVPEGSALPHPNGRVMFCDRNKLYYAPTDTMSPKLLQEIGVTAAELVGISFYRVPTQKVNAWATVVDGKGVIALYDGLGAFLRSKGIDEKSSIAFTMGHELGHIVDSKKVGFSNLNAARRRVLDACNARISGLDPRSVTRAVREETCARDIGANSRGYEYSADNFAISIFARKKYPASINPYAFSDFAKAIGSGKYNAFNTHPEGFERGLQAERSLERAGVPRKK